MKNLKYFIILLFLMHFTSCGYLFKPRCFQTYEFEIPFSISPTKDTLHIGDTLWISADFSSSLLDSTTMQYIEAKNVDFKTDIALARIDITPYLPNVWNSAFAPLILEKGQMQLHTMDMAIKYVYEKERYKFRVGTVCKQTGVYSAFISSIRLMKLDLNPECVENMNTKYLVNNGDIDINNYYMMVASPDTIIQYNLSPSTYRNSGCYSFRVVE